MDSDRLLNLLEQMDPGIVIFDDNLSVSYINRALMLIFPGVHKEDLFSGDIMGLHSERIQTRIRAMVRLMKDSSRPIPFSFKRISIHQSDRYLFIKLIPLLDNKMEDSLNCMLVYDTTPFITNKDHRFIKVPVNSGKEITLIDPTDIFYLEADNIYTKVYTRSGVYFCDFSLRFLEKRLPSEHFYRIHRSYMVNLSKVEKIIKERQSYYLQIQNSDIRLPVSRNKAADFSKKIGLK